MNKLVDTEIDKDQGSESHPNIKVYKSTKVEKTDRPARSL